MSPRGTLLTLGAATLTLGLACGREAPDSGPPGTAERAAATAATDTSAAEPDIEEVRKASAALQDAGIPLYPGARGLDATEFEANTAPFIAVDFFTADSPERVVAFYDREIEDLTTRRDTTIEAGSVRYEFERSFSGLVVRPWNPAGPDSSAFLARFDRRDAQGVSSAELDAYGKMLEAARAHVVANLPRNE